MPKGEIVGIEALLLALMAIRVLEACLMMTHKPTMFYSVLVPLEGQV